MAGPPASGFRLSNAQVFSVWPMRYGGAYVLAWLTARHVDGVAPRHAWPLFLVAGLVVINNLEFGLGALVATVVALACARPPRSRRAAARLAGSVATGLLGAALLVAAFTVIRSGAFPRFGLLLEFPRLFGTLGLVSLRMPLIGLHLALYATFAASICVAAVRLASGEEDRLLTSMLAWSGVFGLIAASYYVGRSDTFKLTALFSAWCFALALLVIVAVRNLVAGMWRPGLAELMVLVGFGLAICTLAETPTPWSQIARLGRTTSTPILRQPAAVRFVAAHTEPAERVAILIPLGHRIAYELGITNVSPYSYLEAIVTRRQLQTLLDDMRRTHAHKLFLPNKLVAPEHLHALARAGFSKRSSRSLFSEWSDAAAPAHGHRG